MTAARDEWDQVVPIDLGITWSAGVSGAHLIQSELRTFLAFYSFSAEGVGVIEWTHCRGAVLGWPNDEVLNGHRLWNRGLAGVGFYGAAEVQRSSWIEAIVSGNSIHPRHDPGMFRQLRHFVCCFHDSTFECIASDFCAWRSNLPMDSVLQALIPVLGNNQRLPFELISRI